MDAIPKTNRVEQAIQNNKTDEQRRGIVEIVKTLRQRQKGNTKEKSKK